MNELILSNEILIRLGFFLCIFFLIALLEIITPRRQLIFSRLVRWYSNLGIAFIDSFFLRWLFPLLAAGMAVFIFEVLLNSTSMFNHGNIYISGKIDRILRCLVVTPDMHRCHHSLILEERNSNFGFNLPWWDRLLGTYCDQPQSGYEQMQIGIETFRNPKYLHLRWLLIQPFVSKEYN